MPGHRGAERHLPPYLCRAPRPQNHVGSWRMMERMPFTKSIFTVSLTEVWRIIVTRVFHRVFSVMMVMVSLLR